MDFCFERARCRRYSRYSAALHTTFSLMHCTACGNGFQIFPVYTSRLRFS